MAKNNSYMAQQIPGLNVAKPKKGKTEVINDEVYKRLKKGIKKIIKVKDIQDAITRYKWNNLPLTISGKELERFLYNKGNLAFFYFKPMDQYFVMPYTLKGGLDFYGRYTTVKPIPVAEGTKSTVKGKKSKLSIYRSMISRLDLTPIYNENEIVDDELDPESACVILYDYTKMVSENIIPRATLQDPIIDVQADCIPYMRTALKNSTGIEGLKVDSEDEASNVLRANKSLDNAALYGDKFIPITGTSLQFQELAGGSVAKAEEFMQAQQSLDNFRVSAYGISNGGVFEKKAHMLGDEQEMNEEKSASPLEDGLDMRKEFCELANRIWGLNISVEINKSVKPEDNGEEELNDEEPGGEENDDRLE